MQKVGRLVFHLKTWQRFFSLNVLAILMSLYSVSYVKLQHSVEPLLKFTAGLAHLALLLEIHVRSCCLHLIDRSSEELGRLVSFGITWTVVRIAKVLLSHKTQHWPRKGY